MMSTSMFDGGCHRQRMGLRTLMVVLVFASFGAAEDCSLFSPPGGCKGPMQRVLFQYAHVAEYNQAWSLGEVPYLEDGNSQAPFRCGQCIPGTNGVQDPLKSCDINEYCTDEARCQDLSEHPLHLASCPFEQAGYSYGWCGTGLHCFLHRCLICVNGHLDTDGRRCVNGRWSYSVWTNFWYEPVNVMLLVLCIALFLLLMRDLFNLVSRKINRIKIQQRQPQQQPSSAALDDSSWGPVSTFDPAPNPTPEFRRSLESDDTDDDDDFDRIFSTSESLSEPGSSRSMIKWR